MKHSYIHIQELSYSIASVELYHNISAHIKAGDKAILLGANGSGKSTLFHCIQGDIQDYQGVCQTHGLVFLVEQEIQFLEHETVYDRLQRNFPDIEDRQFQVGLQAYNLEEYQEVSIEQLSGGQRKKLQFVPLQFLDIDILLLDEPTNHLDAEGIQRLQDFCKMWKGVLFCISHERTFIDAIATDIFALEHQNLIHYVGNYSGYITRKEQYDLAKRKEYEAQQRDKKAMEQRLADLRQRASVYVNPARGKLLRSKEKMYERQFLGEQQLEKPKSQITMEMRQGGGVKGAKRILEWKSQTIFIDKNPLFQLPAGEIRGRQRIHLKGNNGSGKSTLLNVIKNHHHKWSSSLIPSRDTEVMEETIESLFPTDKGDKAKPIRFEKELFSRGPDIKVLYLDQFGLDIITSDSVWQRSVANFPSSRTEADIRAKLRGAGITGNHLKTPMHSLSFGQRTKIRFLQMMAHNYDLLLLDEPTNHLDIPTKEMFEEMLQTYQGSVILISHDSWTLDRLGVTQVWEIKEKQLEIKELFNTM